MATRERKPRNATDSPISDSPSSATTRGGRARGRGRGKSRVARGRVASNATDTTNNDDTESTQSNEDDQSGKQTPQSPRAPSRASNATKEDNDESKTEEIKTTKSPTKAVEPVTKPVSRRSRTTTTNTVAPAVNRSRRSTAGVVRRGAIVKRRTLPTPRGTPRSKAAGVGARRSLPGKTGPGDAEVFEVKPATRKRKQKVDETKKDTRAPEKKDVFKKPAGINVENADSGATTDTELINTRRRRSSSKSTDTVASCPEAVDTSIVPKEQLVNIPPPITVKKEVAEEEENVPEPVHKQNMLDKMAEKFSEAKVADLDIGQLKRAGRPKRAVVSKEGKQNPKEVKEAKKVSSKASTNFFSPLSSNGCRI